MRVAGYVRVSTEEQAASGLGMQAQRETIRLEADRRGWDVEWATDRGLSARSLDRPGLQNALDRVRDGDAEALVVAKLDRLSRSIHDFAGLMERAKREGWSLVCLDLGVDTTTPSGTLMANVFASFAQFERELIGQRTSDALQALKRQGVRLGRPCGLPDEVLDRVWREREAGRTLQEIADGLGDDGVPTATGRGRWWPSTVRSALNTARLDAESDRLRAETPDEIAGIGIEGLGELEDVQ